MNQTTALLFKYYTKSCIYFYIIELYVLWLIVKYFISIRNNNTNLMNYILGILFYILLFRSFHILIELISNIIFLYKII